VGSQPGALTVDEFSLAAEVALVKAAQWGDRAAQDELLARHERRVLAVCRGILGHVEDAEDAAQETLYRALRALSHFRSEASFRTWLLRIAVNVSLSWKRSRRPTEAWDPEHLDVPADAASPEEIVLLRLQLSEALGGLPPHRRAILLRRELEGWDVEEIGKAMGWNTKRVYNELYQARRAVIARQARNEKEEAEG
jgi:RNA polymerase sigma-70 factor, ECF subfamily